MSAPERIPALQRLSDLVLDADADMAAEWAHAEHTGERPDLAAHAVEIEVSTAKDILAEVEALRAERDARVERLLRAGDTLSICAQTTGGTAGPDAGLIEAIKGWERARAALYTAQEADGAPPTA